MYIYIYLYIYIHDNSLAYWATFIPEKRPKSSSEHYNNLKGVHILDLSHLRCAKSIGVTKIVLHSYYFFEYGLPVSAYLMAIIRSY
jgi:hypothetical protein